jgi:hypothetical protein
LVIREGEFVFGQVRGRGLAGAVVPVGGRRVVDRQALQASLEVVRAHSDFVRVVRRAGT